MEPVSMGERTVISLPPKARANTRKFSLSIMGLPLGPCAILFLVVVFALLADVLAPHSPTRSDLNLAMQPPVGFGGDWTFPLGTDQMGRDVLSRVIHGTRISLIVGLSAVFLASAVGTGLGIVSGYSGGVTDSLIMRTTDAMLSIPFIMIAIALVGVLGASITNIILVLGIFGWPQYARVIRSEVLTLREADFVRLAICAGCSKTRVMALHIFPNVINSLIVMSTLQLGTAIIAEASLSFLGLGVQDPLPAWGLMLSQGKNSLTSAWWLALFPGLAISLTCLGANLLGDGLRIRLDPKYRQL